MAAALPLVKLGFLLVRTVAKPIAGRLKDFLKDHDRAPSLRRDTHDGLPIELDIPGSRSKESRDHSHRGRLSTP